MKHSKASMRAHHLQLAHMTLMSAAPAPDETPVTNVRPRVYSTDRFARATNGIAIPYEVRERIAVNSPEATPEQLPSLFGARGFF